MPPYRFDSETGQGSVTLTDSATGRQEKFLLGEYNSKISRIKYSVIVKNWTCNGHAIENPAEEKQADAAPAPSDLDSLISLWPYLTEWKKGAILFLAETDLSAKEFDLTANGDIAYVKTRPKRAKKKGKETAESG